MTTTVTIPGDLTKLRAELLARIVALEVALAALTTAPVNGGKP